MDAIMEARQAKREALHPVSYYWNIVKEMDDSQKLELMAVIIDSMKNRCPAKAEHTLPCNSACFYSDMTKMYYFIQYYFIQISTLG